MNNLDQYTTMSGDFGNLLDKLWSSVEEGAEKAWQSGTNKIEDTLEKQGTSIGTSLLAKATSWLNPSEEDIAKLQAVTGGLSAGAAAKAKEEFKTQIVLGYVVGAALVGTLGYLVYSNMKLQKQLR